MRKFFLQLLVSVDGYFDGPNQELDWRVVDDAFPADFDGMLGSSDGILLGRTTDEGFSDHWPNSTQAEAAKMNTLPKFIASTPLSNVTWPNTTIIAEDVANAVARMKQESGKDPATFGSSILASTLAARGLIDEYRFSVLPGLLGRGQRFPDGLPDRLEPTLQETRVSGPGVVAHYYTPAGAMA